MLPISCFEDSSSIRPLRSLPHVSSGLEQLPRVKAGTEASDDVESASSKASASATIAERLSERLSRVKAAAGADVESASLVDEDRAVAGASAAKDTPSRTPTSGSAEPSVADMESASLTDVETQSSTTVDPLDDAPAATTEQVLAQRWQCDLCFEPMRCTSETPWRLGDERCCHGFCLRCVRGSIQWGGRCPYDNTPIPPIVICGVMGTSEYVYHEKNAEAQRTGGIKCSASTCPGVAPTTAEGQHPPGRPVSCAECGLRHCGRRICGTPWTVGHRCWDVVDEERRRAEADGNVEMELYRSLNAHVQKTKRRLEKAPRFRPCPGCGAMVEHNGGCNMVYHDSCRTRWCFACRRIGSCTDYDCQGPGSGPPTPRWRQPTAPPPAATKLPKVVKLVASIVLMLAIYAACVGPFTTSAGFLNSSSTVVISSCSPTSCEDSSAFEQVLVDSKSDVDVLPEQSQFAAGLATDQGLLEQVLTETKSQVEVLPGQSQFAQGLATDQGLLEQVLTETKGHVEVLPGQSQFAQGLATDQGLLEQVLTETQSHDDVLPGQSQFAQGLATDQVLLEQALTETKSQVEVLPGQPQLAQGLATDQGLLEQVLMETKSHVDVLPGQSQIAQGLATDHGLLREFWTLQKTLKARKFNLNLSRALSQVGRTAD